MLIITPGTNSNSPILKIFQAAFCAFLHVFLHVCPPFHCYQEKRPGFPHRGVCIFSVFFYLLHLRPKPFSLSQCTGFSSMDLPHVHRSASLVFRLQRCPSCLFTSVCPPESPLHHLPLSRNETAQMLPLTPGRVLLQGFSLSGRNSIPGAASRKNE
mgnify:CR=1 FL=1